MSLGDDAYIEAMIKEYGDTTINTNRIRHGMKPVPGGEITVVDWCRIAVGIPLKPRLRLVPNLATFGEAGGEGG